jgi:acyl-CoA thioester hydrolase
MSTSERWPITVDWPVAWGEMDTLGHVNNTVYLRWFETARIAYFDALGLTEGMHGSGVGPILARQTIDYRKPVKYPDRVRIETRVSSTGTTSFTLRFRIVSEKLGVVAEGDGVCVMFDYVKNTKVVLGDELRAAIDALERP